MRSLRSVTVTGTLLSLAVLGVSPAYGCDTEAPPPPQQAAEDADAVFAGTVTGVEQVGDRDVLASFEVTDVWHGPSTDTVKVRTPEDEAMCGVTFSEDHSYLVYANEQDGELETSIATRTTELERADEDLEALGEGDEPAADDGGDGWPMSLAAAALALIATIGFVRRSQG